MRIVLVHPYPWPEVRRGAERYLDDLSAYLGGAGHEVHVVTGTRDRARTERRDDGVTVHYREHLLASRGTRHGVTASETFAVRALAPLLAHRADVVHALTPSGAVAGRLAGLPTIFTILGHPDVEQLPSHPVPWLLWRAAVRTGTVVAALSTASAQALESTMGRRAVVLPPGVRLERFTPNLSPRNGPPRVLVSGSLSDHRKRADLAVAAFAKLLESHPAARLALSGEGDAAWALAAAPNARVRGAIDVLGPGHPDDVPSRYGGATLTLLPAEHEAFGLALVESMACGTPVVCTPSGGMPEIVGDHPVGRVAEAATPRALAEAMDAVIRLAASQATSGACLARARHWGWHEAVGPAHEALYEEVVAARRTVRRAVRRSPHRSAPLPDQRRADGRTPRPSNTEDRVPDAAAYAGTRAPSVVSTTLLRRRSVS